MQRFLLLFFSAFFVLCSCDQKKEKTAIQETEDKVTPPTTQVITDSSKLVGTWTRTDAPYEIRVLEVNNGGTIVAGYFNPNSIHIGRSNWTNSNGMVTMYIELRDENYPGSNYVLVYLPDQDVLTGKYFQAVEGVTYDVSFARKK